MIRKQSSLFRRSHDPQTFAVEVDDAVYPVRINRNRRARRYILRIHAAAREAVLTMPWRGSLADAFRFAEAHRDWLATRLKQLPATAPFIDGEKIPLRGITHRIIHRADRRGTVWTEVAADGECLLAVAGDARHLARRVQDFLKREARRDLEGAVARYAAELGVTVRRLSIRDQASRWGSCNSAGVLSFSWRLILAPSCVLDYLAAHEVAHLIEMNHSRRFWTLVKRVCPHAREATEWLNAQGNALHRYGSD